MYVSLSVNQLKLGIGYRCIYVSLSLNELNLGWIFNANTSYTQRGIFWRNLVNIMSADALAPGCIFLYQIIIMQVHPTVQNNAMENVMALCKTAVSPLLMHWRYHSLALSHGMYVCMPSYARSWHSIPVHSTLINGKYSLGPYTAGRGGKAHAATTVLSGYSGHTARTKMATLRDEFSKSILHK